MIKSVITLFRGENTSATSAKAPAAAVQWCGLFLTCEWRSGAVLTWHSFKDLKRTSQDICCPQRPQENAANLFYCEAPERFSGLWDFPWLSISMEGGADDLIFILGWIYTWQLITSVQQRKLLSHHILQSRSCTGNRQFPLEAHWVHCYDSIYLPPSVENVVCCPCACFTHTSCWLPLSAEPLKNTGWAALRMYPGTRCSIVWPV